MYSTPAPCSSNDPGLAWTTATLCSWHPPSDPYNWYRILRLIWYSMFPDTTPCSPTSTSCLLLLASNLKHWCILNCKENAACISRIHRMWNCGMCLKFLGFGYLTKTCLYLNVQCTSMNIFSIQDVFIVIILLHFYDLLDLLLSEEKEKEREVKTERCGRISIFPYINSLPTSRWRCVVVWACVWLHYCLL